MTQYGNTQEPGSITSVTSLAGVDTTDEAPTDVGIVGQADLSNGTADPNTVYEIGRASDAEQLFGAPADSLLTQAVIDALKEGAFPIYAVATAETKVTGEDHSSISSPNFTLNKGPIRESASTITVTLDGTEQTANIVLDDPSQYSPSAGECYVNPVYGEVQVASTPSSSLTVDYEHFDYASGHDAMASDAGGVIDFLLPLNERRSVVDDANTTVASMEKEYDLALLEAGAEIYIGSAVDYTNPYDDSRTQTVYPTRFEDGSSALAAFVGRRAALGIETTPINKQLRTNKQLAGTQADHVGGSFRGTLLDKNVAPLQKQAAGALIVSDPTTVNESNSAEGNIQFGYTRLVMDFIIIETKRLEQPYIGRLNRPEIRNTLEGQVSTALRTLADNGPVIDYSVNVASADSTTASLAVQLDLAEPLLYVENSISLGKATA